MILSSRPQLKWHLNFCSSYPWGHILLEICLFVEVTWPLCSSQKFTWRIWFAQKLPQCFESHKVWVLGSAGGERPPHPADLPVVTVNYARSHFLALWLLLVKTLSGFHTPSSAPGKVRLAGNKTATSGTPVTLSCQYSLPERVHQVLWRKTAEQGDTTSVAAYSKKGHHSVEEQFRGRVSLSRTLDDTGLTITAGPDGGRGLLHLWVQHVPRRQQERHGLPLCLWWVWWRGGGTVM